MMGVGNKKCKLLILHLVSGHIALERIANWRLSNYHIISCTSPIATKRLYSTFQDIWVSVMIHLLERPTGPKLTSIAGECCPESRLPDPTDELSSALSPPPPPAPTASKGIRPRDKDRLLLLRREPATLELLTGFEKCYLWLKPFITICRKQKSSKVGHVSALVDDTRYVE